MTDDVGRRLTKLEGTVEGLSTDMATMEANVTHLENYATRMDHALFSDAGLLQKTAKMEAKQDEILRKIEEVKKATNGGSKKQPQPEAVTFRWVVERIMLPIIMPLITSGGVVYFVLKAVEKGAIK